MKHWFWRITILIAASALLTFATLIKSDYEYVHASKWDPAVPLHESTAFRITVWGWPIRFVSDSPLSDRWEAMDFGDEFHLASFIMDWVLWLMGLRRMGNGHSVFQRGHRRNENDSREPAGRTLTRKST